MAGLDDAGVDRADRDLVQPWSVHRQEFVIGWSPARPQAFAHRAERQGPIGMIEHARWSGASAGT